MKRFITIILLSFSLNSMQGQPIIKCDTTSMEEILKFDYSRFIGRTVGELLLLDPIRKYKRKTFLYGTPGVLSGMYFELDDHFYVQVLVFKYKYQQQLNKTMNWDFELFLKETISKIRFVKRNKCLLEVE